MASILATRPIDGVGALFLFRETDRAIACRQRRRLNAAIVLSAALIGALFVPRIDWTIHATPKRERAPITVHVQPTSRETTASAASSPVVEQASATAENAHEDAAEDAGNADTVNTAAASRSGEPAAPEQRNEPPIDWVAQLQREARAMATLESSEDDVFYFSNNLRERKEAAVKYAPVPPPKRIWDNVEKDIYGRTILRSGNCYRVLDDPRATNRWAFETFEQHMVFCEPEARGPKRMHWVKTIRDRYGMNRRD